MFFAFPIRLGCVVKYLALCISLFVTLSVSLYRLIHCCFLHVFLSWHGRCTTLHEIAHMETGSQIWQISISHILLEILVVITLTIEILFQYAYGSICVYRYFIGHGYCFCYFIIGEFYRTGWYLLQALFWHISSWSDDDRFRQLNDTFIQSR
jgi:hypothetical protein